MAKFKKQDWVTIENVPKEIEASKANGMVGQVEDVSVSEIDGTSNMYWVAVDELSMWYWFREEELNGD